MANQKSVTKPWYQVPVAETAAFFDTSLQEGLGGESVAKRLKRFGENINPSVPNQIGRLCKVSVIRNGKLQAVSLNHVVLGDIVSLKTGDRVPADLRLFKVNKLEIDETVLGTNGLPTTKNTYAITKKEPLARQKCMAFSGTFVTKGQGLGIVVTCGPKVAYLPPLKQLKSFKNNLVARRLKRFGVIASGLQDLSVLPKVDSIIFDADLNDQAIGDIVRKLQLIKNIPCKFITDSAQANRLQKELTGAEMVEANKFAKQTAQQIAESVSGAQFITNIDETNSLKILRILRDDGEKIAWVTDGKKAIPALRVADISIVIVSDASRDDVVFKAGLILPRFEASALSSIFYNKK
jgi:magnesium-transporting ATPase (P-type)